MLTARSTTALVAHRSARSAVRTNAAYKVTVKNPRGGESTFTCSSDEYILDAAEAAGLDMPSSCRSGTCCTCAGRLVSGKVNQEEQTFLDDAQMDKGYALLCVSYPLSDIVVESEVHALNPLMK